MKIALILGSSQKDIYDFIIENGKLILLDLKKLCNIRIFSNERTQEYSFFYHSSGSKFVIAVLDTAIYLHGIINRVSFRNITGYSPIMTRS